jgi:hypothetical protein
MRYISTTAAWRLKNMKERRLRNNMVFLIEISCLGIYRYICCFVELCEVMLIYSREDPR